MSAHTPPQWRPLVWGTRPGPYLAHPAVRLRRQDTARGPWSGAQFPSVRRAHSRRCARISGSIGGPCLHSHRPSGILSLEDKARAVSRSPRSAPVAPGHCRGPGAVHCPIRCGRPPSNPISIAPFDHATRPYSAGRCWAQLGTRSSAPVASPVGDRPGPSSIAPWCASGARTPQGARCPSVPLVRVASSHLRTTVQP